MRCWQCYQATEPAWLVCPRCAAPLAAQPYGPPAGALPPDSTPIEAPILAGPPAVQDGRRRNRLRIAALVTAVVVVAALPANDLSTRSALRSTRASLKSTSASLATARSDLAAVRSDLSTTQTSLQLAQSQVNTLKSELASSEGALAGATSLIGLLKTCLDGITQTVSDLAGGLTFSALGALSGVQSACNQAQSELTTVQGA